MSMIFRSGMPSMMRLFSRSHFITSRPSRYTWTWRGGWSPIQVVKTYPPRRILVKGNVTLSGTSWQEAFACRQPAAPASPRGE